MGFEMERYKYLGDCVGWDPKDVDAEGGLVDMIEEATKIRRYTFLRHVGIDLLKYLEQKLGYVEHYTQGLIMAKDQHVTYHSSRLHGKKVYFVRQSGVEYVYINRNMGES